MKLIFYTTKNYPDITKLEIEIQYNCQLQELQPGIYLGESEKTLDAITFGYVKEIYELKKIFLLSNYEEELEKLDIKDHYKIHVTSNNKNYTTMKVADDIYKYLKGKAEVNVNKPEHEYEFLIINENVYFLELQKKNTDEPHERKAHKKTYNHPTSLDPRLAKALINITGTNEFIDPFCGVGGIVIEGLIQGRKAQGSDISKELIGKAKINAENYGLQAKFETINALELNKKTQAIITDLPYGRNSILTEELEELYKKFFTHAQKLTTTMMIGMMKENPIEEQLQGTTWKIKHRFDIYVHKSLSRTFLLLKQ